MSRNGQLILLVDDDPDIPAILKAGLAMHGYRTECATTGRDALNLAQCQTFDIAIVDLQLRGALRGDALALALMRLDIPLIMTSRAMHAPEHLAKLRFPFLAKPFDWAALLRLIEQNRANRR